jgi:CRP-like cAMP-binding protein
MKTNQYQWDHPHLAKYRKILPQGQYLFRQGEEGSTMFIIARGIIQLMAERDGAQLVVSYAQAGDFLGEKAIVGAQPHKRFFTAVAKSEVQYLELDLAALAVIEGRNPDLFKDILKEMFLLAARRLDHANYLNRVLRSSKNTTRLLNLILHFAVCTGRKQPHGWEVSLTVDRIRYFIDMSQFEVEECLKALEGKGLLVPQGDDFFVIPNEQALLSAVPLLKDAIPNIESI